jgi:hypothetical protein
MLYLEVIGDLTTTLWRAGPAGLALLTDRILYIAALSYMLGYLGITDRNPTDIGDQLQSHSGRRTHVGDSIKPQTLS